MSDYQRKYSEVLAMAKLEPELKNIYVEGMSDVFFLGNFFDYAKVKDIAIYGIETIDLSELYDNIGQDKEKVIHSNKEKVILLSRSLENDVNDIHLHTLCIVDLDWDEVLNKIRCGRYLTYTDYNSMDMYLFDARIVEKYLHEGHRISTVKSDNILNSLASLCRQVFHLHCLMHERSKPTINNDKAFLFDKTNQTCALNFEDLWVATLMKNNLMREIDTLRSVYEARMATPCVDVRKEIRGHDFVYYLYLCAKGIKSKIKMTDEEFANMFWKFANYEQLFNEPLFQRILAL